MESAQNPTSDQTQQNSTNENPELKGKLLEWLRHSFKMDELPQLVEKIKSDDIFSQHYAVIGLRNLLLESK